MKEALMNIITQGTKIEGRVYINGSVRIDGEVNAEHIEATEKIIIGPQGVLKGNVKSKNLSCSGLCEGVFHITELVEFLKGASFDGELACKRLVVEEGVLLDGSVSMKGEKRGKIKTHDKAKEE